MSTSSLRIDIASLEKRLATYEKDHSRFLEKAAKAANASSGYAQRAMKTSSASSQRSYLRSAETEEKKSVDARKKAAAVVDKIATVKKSIADKTNRLDAELKRERDKAKRADEKRRRDELSHARTIAQLSRPEVRHVIIAPPKPEMLRILYLTASPETGDRHLRVDAEVNGVLKALRGAPYRDQVDLQVRPAAGFQDLLDGVNDLRPHVIHFSGHGTAGILAFDNSSFDEPESVVVRFDTLAETLSGTTDPPKLLVMNACSSLMGSDILLEAVPILIGMQDSVGDASAGVFATQFYAAIASAQPVGFALRQAKASMKAALMKDDSELPKIAHRSDTNPDETNLIVARPH